MTHLRFYAQSALFYQRPVHGWRRAARYFWAHRRYWFWLPLGIDRPRRGKDDA